MAIRSELDNKRYHGTLGGLRRVFDSKIKNELGRDVTVKEQIKEDMLKGVFWNPTSKRDAWDTISGTSMFGLAIGTMAMSLAYMIANDAVDFSDNNASAIYSQMQEVSAGESVRYTVLSQGLNEMPYLLYENEGRVFVFEPQKDNGFFGASDAEDLIDYPRWEWNMLEPDEAYTVIRELGFSLDEYHEAANDREAGFLNSISPVTTYTVDNLSVMYSESDDVRITTGAVEVSNVPITLDYIATTDGIVGEFKDDMVEGLYGFEEGQGPFFDTGMLDESSLNRTASFYFGAILPFYFLMGAGMGVNNVRRRLTDVKKGKRDFAAKP
jgi:hypothetical protein